MQDNSPRESQSVQVRMGSGNWQPATYRGGHFIDRFGLILNPERIAEWQPDAEDVHKAPHS